MRPGINIDLSSADRLRLEALVRDRNTAQKHVWRARIVLLSATGMGTNAIIRETGKSKTCVWRWQERFAGRVEDWRASVRVRWLLRRFRFGPQSGSLDYVSSPRSSNRTCGFPASGFRTRSCLRSRKALGRVRQASEAVFVLVSGPK